MHRLRSRAGQIVIPAMLIFPTLFLFVYLIYETVKLSREKIRHQFAMDAAAFVEMANYSDFLNRTAYVNGAFPMRIFTEGYGDFKAECDGKTDNCQQAFYADMLYANGAFPRSASGKSAFTGDDHSWDIEYCGKAVSPFTCAALNAGKNASPPTLAEPFTLFIEADANQYWHPYDLATEIYKLYVQVYSLLGSVEDAQLSVLKRLSSNHSFMAKSYYLNTNESAASADALVREFDSQMSPFTTQSVKPICQATLDYWGNVRQSSGIQPYQPNHTEPVVQLKDVVPPGQFPGLSCTGLFQFMWVDTGILQTMKNPGISLGMQWAIPPKNFFNVDFVSMMNQAYPQGSLRTTISVQGDPSNKPAVWPDPTPKFQVRQFP